MISRHLVYLMTAAIVGGAHCNRGEGEGDGSADPYDCLKPLCSGNITVSPDYDSVCESRCEMRVEQSEEDSCLSEYEALLTCLDETSCAEYYLWYEQTQDAPCNDLEAKVASLCPSIDLRDAE